MLLALQRCILRRALYTGNEEKQGNGRKRKSVSDVRARRIEVSGKDLEGKGEREKIED